MGPVFITRDYTFTRHRAINSALNRLRIIVIQIAHGFAGGEMLYPGPDHREASFIHLLPDVDFSIFWGGVHKCIFTTYAL